MELAEFHALWTELELVINQTPIESKPFEYKYQVLERLQKILTLPLEKNVQACIQVKIGTLQIQVEDFHRMWRLTLYLADSYTNNNLDVKLDADVALDEAAAILCPNLHSYIKAKCKEHDKVSLFPIDDIQEFLTEIAEVDLSVLPLEFSFYIFELLQQLGFLWSSREQPLRALGYFHACLKCAMTVKLSDTLKTTEIITYSCFYLAQVYTQLNNLSLSSQFCAATLAMQFMSIVNPNTRKANSSPPGDIFEWIKNCLQLVQYYFNAIKTENSSAFAIKTQHLHAATDILELCDYFLYSHLDKVGNADNTNNELRIQYRAEVAMSWATLQKLTLQIVVEGISACENNATRMTGNADMKGVEILEQLHSTLKTTNIRIKDCKAYLKQQGSLHTSTINMKYIDPMSVIGGKSDIFDAALPIFQLGQQAAKFALSTYFHLDGFVTTHIRLHQVLSGLYHHLIELHAKQNVGTMESLNNQKKRLGLQLRRLAVLSPLLQIKLNEDYYRDLVQELYYEAGEVLTDIFQIKSNLSVLKDTNSTTGSSKITQYGLRATHCYTQFLLLCYNYKSNSTENSIQPPSCLGYSKNKSILLPPDCHTPKEVETLIRTFLKLAQVYNNLQDPTDKQKTLGYWGQALACHEAVVDLINLSLKTIPELQKSSLNNHQKFLQDELEISNEMKRLLPTRINQLYTKNVML